LLYLSAENCATIIGVETGFVKVTLPVNEVTVTLFQRQMLFTVELANSVEQCPF